MRLADKNTSAVSLVKEALEKAKKYAKYNIFTFLNEEGALRRAAEIDEKIARGEDAGRLAGVVFGLKDNFLSRDGATTASAHILEGCESPVVATAVEKLEAEGAIMLGRTNLDAFAHGSSTENSYYGPSHNSRDFDRVPGGSSGGSAVAVALDIVEFATGTDTGGSIRQPASFNGIYGMKPTYGTISRYGVVAMASSLDCVGFFAKSPEDMDLLMSVTAGQDPKDMTTLPDFYDGSRGGVADTACPSDSAPKPRRAKSSCSLEHVTSTTPPATRAAKKIGIIKDFDNEVVDSEIREALAKKCELLKSKGHEIVELEMPALKYALAVYYIIQPAEVASNLSRYDGVRYGFRSEESRGLSELYENTRSEGFMPENKRRIMIGNFVLSSGFYDAYFLKAAKARTMIINEYAKAFSKCDYILTPVSPNPAFRLGEKVDDPVAMYLEDLMSVSLNLAGLPGLAVPAGDAKDGRALGLQLVGPRRSDKALIEFSKELI